MVIDDLKLKLCLNLLESLYFDEYILKSLVCSPSYTNEKKKKKRERSLCWSFTYIFGSQNFGSCTTSQIYVYSSFCFRFVHLILNRLGSQPKPAVKVATKKPTNRTKLTSLVWLSYNDKIYFRFEIWKIENYGVDLVLCFCGTFIRVKKGLFGTNFESLHEWN